MIKVMLGVILVFLCSCAGKTENVGEFIFDDGKIWVNVTTNSGFGSQLEVARQLFKKRAVELCGNDDYLESDIVELNNPSGLLPPGGELGAAHQIASRSGFIICAEVN